MPTPQLRSCLGCFVHKQKYMTSFLFHCHSSCDVALGSFLVIVISIHVCSASSTKKLPQIGATDKTLKHDDQMLLDQRYKSYFRKKESNQYQGRPYTGNSYTSRNSQKFPYKPSTQSKLPDVLESSTSTYNLEDSGYRPATSDRQKQTTFKTQSDELPTQRQIKRKQTKPIPFNFATDRDTASGYSHSMKPRERALRARKMRDEMWLKGVQETKRMLGPVLPEEKKVL